MTPIAARQHTSHGHDHAHEHHDAHDRHHHDHALRSAPVVKNIGSLLLLGAGQRLGMVAVAIVGLWAATYWALS